MAIQRHHFDLFADYHQFYLQDEPVDGNLSDSWTQEATDRLLAITDGTVGVGTARNMMVSVDVQVLDAEPHHSFDEWNQVNECSINVGSGRIVIAGCTDYFPDAARIQVAPGMYRARIYYAKLDTLSEDGLEGEDHYRVVLWRSDATPPVVLKQRQSGRDR
jgi:hypothetical protein